MGLQELFEANRDDKIVSALLTQLPWTLHLIILGHTKAREERRFYMVAAIEGRWTSRELLRQVRAQALRRSVLEPAKVSTQLGDIDPEAVESFRNVRAPAPPAPPLWLARPSHGTISATVDEPAR